MPPHLSLNIANQVRHSRGDSIGNPNVNAQSISAGVVYGSSERTSATIGANKSLPPANQQHNARTMQSSYDGQNANSRRRYGGFEGNQDNVHEASSINYLEPNKRRS